jgi:hypothetical protein
MSTPFTHYHINDKHIKNNMYKFQFFFIMVDFKD